MQSGSRIGDFELKQLIGQGGFGQVYIGRQHEPVKRDVAVKILRPGMVTKEIMARFLAEQQSLAMMNHPNIARIIEVGGNVDGQPYFVMELVDGIPLTEYCDQHELTPNDRMVTVWFLGSVVKRYSPPSLMR